MKNPTMVLICFIVAIACSVGGYLIGFQGNEKKVESASQVSLENGVSEFAARAEEFLSAKKLHGRELSETFTISSIDRLSGDESETNREFWVANLREIPNLNSKVRVRRANVYRICEHFEGSESSLFLEEKSRSSEGSQAFRITEGVSRTRRIPVPPSE